MDKRLADNADGNWADDAFGQRKAEAQFLTRAVVGHYQAKAAADQSVEPHLVASLRADWGAGKSFFLERLAKDLRRAGHGVAFIDAWQSDFSDDPLVPFIAAVDRELRPYLAKAPVMVREVDRLKAVGARLSKKLAIGLAEVLAKKVTGMTFEEVVGLLSEEAEGAADDNDEGDGDANGGDDKNDSPGKVLTKAALAALSEHEARAGVIDQFRKRLARVLCYLHAHDHSKPPFFIVIDELDRCRPTYAIEFLEAVKHVFEVPGTVFIVATNATQLAHSVRAIYGSGFDGEAYLTRFFECEYLLPNPRSTEFARSILKGVIDLQRDRLPLSAPQCRDSSHFASVFRGLATLFGLQLRGQKQVVAMLEAIVSNWPSDESIQWVWLVALVMLRHGHMRDFEELTGIGSRRFQVFDAKLDALAPSSSSIDLPGGMSIAADDLLRLYVRLAPNNMAFFHDEPVPSGHLHRQAITEHLVSDFPVSLFPRHFTPMAEYPSRVAFAGLFVGRGS